MLHVSDLPRMQLLTDRVLLMPIPPKEKERLIILQPHDRKEPTVFATVILMGPTAQDKYPDEVEQGTEVIVRKQSGLALEVLDRDGTVVQMYIGRIADVLACIDYEGR